jgi:hypothetical protein
MENIVRKAALGAAAIVGAKYLDAKMDISNDYNIISSAILTQIRYIIFGRTRILLTRVWQRKERRCQRSTEFLLHSRGRS